MHKDTKLLFAIAGIVLVVAAGITVLGIWSAGKDQPVETATTRTPEPPPPAVTVSVEPATLTVPPAIEPEPVEETPGPFVVDPDANWIARGVTAYEAREFDVAVAYFEAETQARDDRAWSFYMLGLSLWKAGQADAGAEAMARSAELDGSSSRTFVNLSRIHNDRGDYTAALDAARKAIEVDAEAASGHFLEGRSLSNLGRVDEAIASFTRSLEIDPDNGYVHNLLGLTLMEADRDAEALPAFERAAELTPDVAYIQNNLGMAFELNGRRDDAAEAYRRAATLDPGHVKAVANLSRLEPESAVAEVDSEDDA